jgi:hypothetical protein
MAARLNFDFKIATILLLLGVIPMSLGTWWLFRSYEDAYLELAGARLGDSAETALSSISSYLQNQIINVAGLAEVPVIREAITRANQDLQKNQDEIRKSITATETNWAGLSADAPAVKAVTQGPAADFLRRYLEVNKSYREITVTDYLGRVTVATSKPRKSYEALSDWWKETYGDGRRGSVYIGDLYWGNDEKSHLMDIAQPIIEHGGGFAGVIRATLDAQAIHALLGSFQPGTGASVGVIHAKGDVISALGFSSLQQSSYPATVELLSSREKGRRYFVSSGTPSAIFGLSQRSISEMYPHLNWIVFATGRTSDLMGALPQLRKMFVFLIAGVVILALSATLMLSVVESMPVLEEDPHLDKL